MKTLIFLVLALLGQGAQAFDYFQGHIDYWKAPKAEKPPEPPPTLPSKKELKQESPIKVEESKFDWQKFADPKNKDFFKEGDYTPPEPFMELARNPSDENIRQWFAMIETKNKLMEAMNKRIQEYVAKSGPSLKQDEAEIVAKQQQTTIQSNIDVKRFRFRLYFDSACPHCKNMITTMTEIRGMGYYTEVKQIDDRIPDFPIPFPIARASPEELKAKEINAWPVTFVADTVKQVVYRLNGYLPTSEVLKILSSK